jgi:ribosomal protein S18 acetylase RimI-like enzyme
MMAAHADIEAIEQAFVAQWSNFGHAPGGIFHEEGDLIWAEAPVPQLPYNAVIRTKLGMDAEARIKQVINRFRERAAQFLWVVHPTAQPDDLIERLVAKGLSLVECPTGMSLDLTTWSDAPNSMKGPITYREVTDEQGLQAYERLIDAYWELPEQSHPYVFGLSRWIHASRDRAARWVAYRDRQPVGKIYLSYLGAKDTAAIFGVYVSPTARGYGIASALSKLAISRAAKLGRTRVVLHSSEMAINVYRRLGFIDRCVLPFYATTALHSLQPMLGCMQAP